MHDQTFDATTVQPSKPGGFKFAHFLYNQNPFYLISAALVLYGFSVSVTQEELTNSPLALSAWAIVRFGKVWDDARSILMVLLLLLLALSSSVDSFCMTKPQTALALATAGFAFAVVLSEFLIRSMGIKFGRRLRGPLYAMLGVSFFFPLVFAAQPLYFPQTALLRICFVGGGIVSSNCDDHLVVRPLFWIWHAWIVVVRPDAICGSMALVRVRCL